VERKPENVTSVPEAGSRFCESFGCWKGETIMKKISLVFALAFGFTTGMAVVTAVAHTDRAMADSAGTVIVCPEQASQCDGTNC
jgi:hypothetical protein